MPLPALAAVAATEFGTGQRLVKPWWVAAVLIQAAAILFFFAATGFLTAFVHARLSLLVACLPLMGALTAWGQFRGYNRIRRLHQKAWGSKG